MSVRRTMSARRSGNVTPTAKQKALFASGKQRRFLKANKPDVANRWEAEEERNPQGLGLRKAAKERRDRDRKRRPVPRAKGR